MLQAPQPRRLPARAGLADLGRAETRRQARSSAPRVRRANLRASTDWRRCHAGPRRKSRRVNSLLLRGGDRCQRNEAASALCDRLHADNLVSDLAVRSEALSLLRERVLRRLKADIAARSSYPQTKPTRNANVNSVASILYVREIIWC